MHALWTSVAAPVLAAALALTPLPAAALPPAASPPAATPSTTPDSADVTWSVRPGDAAGPDGRSWIEWEADPGATRTERLVVSNFGDREVTFRLAAADGYFTDTGRFSMLPSDRSSTEAGTWITLPGSVTVAAGGSEVVPFTIVVPDDASPGDHPAGVAASILSVGSGAVGVESRIGFRVMTRVTGDLRAEIATGISGGFTGSVNPFEPGRLEVAYEVSNTGNTRLRAQPVVTVAGPFGVAASEHLGDEILDIAPGETRTGSVPLTRAWPLFWYDARVTVTPVAVSDELRVEETRASSASTAVAAVPFAQLVTLALAVGLLVAWLWQRRRNRASTARLIQAARAEGRAEAAAGEATDVSSDSQPDMSPTPSAPPLRRRNARPSAWAIALVATGVATLTFLGTPGTDAWAATPQDPAGVEVRVDITPAPAATPSPDPTPAPTPTPSRSATPSDSTSLPATGGGFDPGLLVVGATLALAGIAGTASWRARRR